MKPSTYNTEMADIICERIAEGQSMRTISKAEDTPCLSTMFQWIRENPEFRISYEKAKEQQADALAEEILDIADDGSNDWMESNNPNNPGWQQNGECIQRSKVRIDTRKWLAGKLRPKKYGDATTIRGDAENPLQLTLADRLQAAIQKRDGDKQ